METWPGHAYPLGATYDGSGTNFALFSEVAERVELCLFDDGRGSETPGRADRGRRLRLARLPARQSSPGQRYGYRVHGPYDPDARACAATRTSCCSTPTPRRSTATIDWDQSLFGYDFGDPDSPQRRRLRGAHAARRGHQPVLRLGGDRRPRIPYNETVIYEAHVKGLTQLHPDVPEELRGTYAGLAHPAIIEHLQEARRHRDRADAGAPVRRTTARLLDKGLRNYWGYNTIGFFAPHAEYAADRRRSASRCRSSRRWCKALHAAGIEVILDVVYNHTAEGNHLGPTLCFKGIDNAGLLPARRRRPALLHGLHRHRQQPQRPPPALAAADHGLAALLGDRDARRRLPLRPGRRRWPASSTTSTGSSTFFELVQQDPVVSQVKLIAEPWDVGPGGYQVGNFPPQWTEWNGKYRDTVRDFWRGEPAARRVRLPAHRLRRPLRALRPPPVRQHQLRHRPRRLHAARPGVLQREAQRGQRRGQPRRREPQPVVELRRRGPDRRPGDPRRCGPAQQRNFLATLLLCQGVPMLLHGDELGRTQHGNNNAYCQDNEISLGRLGPAPTSRCSSSPRRSPGCARATRCSAAGGSSPARRCARGDGERLNDIVWLHPDGRAMSDEDWDARRPGDRHVPQRPRHRRHATPAASGSPTTTSCSASTPTTTGRLRPCRRRSTPRRGTSSSTPAATPTPTPTCAAGRRST